MVAEGDFSLLYKMQFKSARSLECFKDFILVNLDISLRTKRFLKQECQYESKCERKYYGFALL